MTYLQTSEVVNAVDGLTFRQMDYWTRTGRIRPAAGPAGASRSGSGDRRMWEPAQVEFLRIVVARLAWGMTLDTAFRTQDPPLPTFTATSTAGVAA